MQPAPLIEKLTEKVKKFPGWRADENENFAGMLQNSNSPHPGKTQPGLENTANRKYENEVLIMDVHGQGGVNRFVNYRNNTPLGDLAAGIYFYRIRLFVEGEVKDYSGRLLITE